MNDAIIFLLGTAFFVWVSPHALRNPRSHGFYRFFAWECILLLVLLNLPMWDVDSRAPRQLVSWALLYVSAVLPVHALILLLIRGRPNAARSDAELIGFERTSTLVTSGAYRYIRHPMYAALLFLAWGAFLKDVSLVGSLLVAGASVALWLTALREEAESLQYFGAPYAEYMKSSRRFIPFVL